MYRDCATHQKKEKERERELMIPITVMLAQAGLLQRLGRVYITCYCLYHYGYCVLL